MKTDQVCMMEPIKAAELFILALVDPEMSEEARERITTWWNEDVRRNRREK